MIKPGGFGGETACGRNLKLRSDQGNMGWGREQKNPKIDRIRFGKDGLS